MSVILLFCIIIGLILSIEKRSGKLYWHTIKRGKHFEKFSLRRFRVFKFRNSASYEVMFDETCIYDPKKFGNDINKLCGFTDINSKVHKDSLRFGWRPNQKLQIDIFAYWYVNGKRGFSYIDSIELHEIYTLRLSVKRKSYKFEVVGSQPQFVIREKKNRFGLKLRLFPYFGGNDPAPHNIRIYLKEKL